MRKVTIEYSGHDVDAIKQAHRAMDATKYVCAIQNFAQALEHLRKSVPAQDEESCMLDRVIEEWSKATGGLEHVWD